MSLIWIVERLRRAVGATSPTCREKTRSANSEDTNGAYAPVWFALAAFLFLSPDTFAQFVYVTNGSTITVTSYRGPIPDSLTISNFVTAIGNSAFAGSSSVTNITLGTNITSIGVNPFEGCSKLVAVTVSAQNTNFSSLNGVLFNKSQTALLAYPGGASRTYTVPNGVTNIETNAFEQCDSLAAVILPASMVSIAPNAFYWCSDLSGVTISNGLTSIGQNAFELCVLTNITIPDSVLSVGASAFQDCSGLTNVTIGSGVTNIGLGAFTACSGLAAIKVSPQNAYYSSVNGVLFDKTQATLVQFPGGAGGNYTIPNTVTTIAAQAFSEQNSQLTGVVIPDSVTTIGASAFAGCSSLSSVVFGNGITSIGAYAFESCWDLTSITLPGHITSIGEDAFANNYLSGILFDGNAPTGTDPTAFSASSPPTIYDLPGSTNWTQFTASTGLVPVLWNPAIQPNANLGVQNNQFGFTITGTTNIPIQIAGTTNLSLGTWTPLQTCTLTNGSIQFTDPGWSNYPTRFYTVQFP